MTIHLRPLYYQNNENYAYMMVLDNYLMTINGRVIQLIWNNNGLKL